MAKMASGDLSLTSTSSQEEEGPEYVGYDRTLRPSSNSSGSGASAPNMSNNNNNNSNNNNNNGGGVGVGGNSVGSAGSGGANVTKYEAIKSQYDAALHELTTLRHQHADTVRRCDDFASQLSFYQAQYMAAMNQLKASDRNKFTELVAENARLKQQNSMLELKLMRLDCDYGDVAAAAAAANRAAKCDGSCAESEKLLEELHLSKERHSDLLKERGALVGEREKYKKSFDAAIVDLETAIKERSFYRDSAIQRDMVEKENQKLKALLAAESKKVLMSTVQRNRIEEELNQLLSEKDNVLQEHQKMSDDLAAANKELDQYKTELKKALQQSRESSWSKEFSTDGKDDFKEIEKLRKNLEKAHSEVERAAQDTEEAIRVRDWAISQREKIVQERDSVKTLCDTLRKERDKAISDQLSAIRDSEKIKKLKDEAQKKIDALKEQIENHNLQHQHSMSQSMDAASRRSFRMSTYEANEMLDIYHNDQDIGLLLDDGGGGVGVVSGGGGVGVVVGNRQQMVCGVPNVAPGFAKLKMNEVHCKVVNSGPSSRQMTTSATQTDASVDAMHHPRATSAKHPSKIAEMLSKFKEKIHISKSSGGGASETDHLAQENDALAALDSVLSENSSEKSKRSKRSKKEKEAAAKSMGTWPRTNILNATHENPTGTIVQREKKRPPLSLFEPVPINIDKDDDDDDDDDDDEEEERDRADDQAPPPLPPQAKPSLLANMRNGIAASAIKSNPNRNSNPIPASVLFHGSTANGGPGSGGPGGGNNYMRHSVYVPPTAMEQEPLVMEQTKPLQRPAPITTMRVKMPSASDKYGQQLRAHNYQNRYSLNITPTESYKTSGQQAQQQVINTASGGTAAEYFMRKQQMFDMMHGGGGGGGGGSATSKSAHFMPLQPHANAHYTRNSQQQQQQQQQQNSLDMISLKSQNSIDSILSTKSPPISEYTIASNYPKRTGMPMPQAGGGGGGKNVAKYPSDSESIASGILNTGGVGGGGGAFFQSNMPPPNRHTQLFPTYTPPAHSSYPHPHPLRQIRHSSPLTLPSPPPLMPHASSSSSAAHAQHEAGGSGAIGIPTSSVDKFDMDYVSPAHNHLHQPHHHQHHPHASYLHDYAAASPPLLQAHYPQHGGVYEGGTFPRKKDHQRLRIPSNPSVASKSSGVKNSSGSIDHHHQYGGGPVGNGGSGGGGMNSYAPPSSGGGSSIGGHHHHAAVASVAATAANGGGGSGRGSPMPLVHVEVLSHGGSKRNSNVPADFLCAGDLRRVTIDKSDKSLGITIQCNNNGGGIFVSTVAERSIATRAGLQVGDQLLEVCGINMRSATNDIAANVLRQCGNSITMLVQYNPEKFLSAENDITNNLETEPVVNHSGSPTPRNSPRPPVRPMLPGMGSMPPSLARNSPAPTHVQNPVVMLPSASSLLSSHSIKDQSFADSLENQSDISSSQDLPLGSVSAATSTTTATTTASTTSTLYEEEARYINLHMDKSKNLGIKLFGGNKVGIFVHDVHAGSPSDHAGIRRGDQILEYNGVDLRCVTAEQAANEISKFTDSVTMLVQNKLKKLKQIKDKSGDSFYIRVGFDRTSELHEGELRFVKDEVLYVDNTIFNGNFGLWRAWKLDAKGHRKECGIIPSQMKVEEEIRSGESGDGESGNARRGSTSARRSFFRRKKHQRSSSRDSTEIASFSNTQLSFFPDSGILNDEATILSYQRVERLDTPVRRPVLIIGPLSECVMDRLTIDFSNLFKLCDVTTMDCLAEAMEEGLQQNIFVDYRRRGNKFEATTIESINNSCQNDRRHCILDISISAVERLQRLHIYPIVLLLRFKSAKQIREIRDFGTDKISAKAAKEMYERALKLESDYKQYITAVIPGVSIKHMCTQIKDSVDKEQDKLLWVPVANNV